MYNKYNIDFYNYLNEWYDLIVMYPKTNNVLLIVLIILNNIIVIIITIWEYEMRKK